MAYIAPEQLNGETIDNRADIYAVGRIIEYLFPHRYRTIAHRCTRVERARRYSSCAHVARALKRSDNLRLWLPLSLLMLLIPCAAIWGIYAGYQRSARVHFDQESELLAHIDSLRMQNDERQSQVDSLNRVVDSLVVKSNTPSPRDVVRKKAADLHFARHAAIRKAIKKGNLKTMAEVRKFDGGLGDNFKRTEQSIKDPILHEEFMQAYFSYFNLNDQLYDSLALILPDK